MNVKMIWKLLITIKNLPSFLIKINLYLKTVWFGNIGNFELANEKHYFIGNEKHIENFKDKCYSTTSENEI